MAANINIGTPIVGTNGKTITITLSGGSGIGYAPASGITGLTVKATVATLSNVYTIASTAISLAVLTITLNPPIPSTASAVSIDIAAGSNLTDSGSNTATGQTGVSATNNSAQPAPTAFAINNANALNLGDITDGSLAGRNYRITYETRVKLTGTDAFVVFYGAGANSSFTVYIDGGSGVTKTIQSTSDFVIVPVFTGLSDSAHEVRVVNSFGYSDKDNFYRVVGSSPAIGQSSVFGTSYQPRSGTVSPHINITGDYSATSSGPGLQYVGTAGSSIRFKSNSANLSVYAAQNTSAVFRLIIDGVDSGSDFAANATPLWDLTQVGSGLDTSTQHDYEIISVGSASQHYLYSILTSGSGTLDLTATISARSVSTVFYGDSIVLDAGIPGELTWTYRSSRLRASISAFQLNGVGGTAVVGSGNAGESRTGQITSLSGITEVHTQYGTNDSSVNVGNGTFATSFTNMLSLIRTGLPSARIYVYALLPETGFPSRNTIIASVASGISNCQYCKTTDDIVLVSDTTDGRHPNALGCAKISNAMLPYLATSGVTISGPSSGSVGVDSFDFTVTIATNSTFNGTQTVTLSDGGNGGTFTPSVGSPGTSSVTVTPANAASSFTFKYKPASGGTKTLTPTNGQGWTNPATNSFSVDSSGSTRIPSIPLIPSIPSVV